ncbi:VOC family protein [Actomonas aquatica]|uniref:VOC family protein n=1 Tax=Actomonas aquatica TaxID=2866162 RepID=A0ABZ1C1Z4_9BACT|nr:VOC family protein [Opitutus sp. WL0086]WRQ85678.1 VOC family protein [Opitutus sp. WL0086]
MSAPSLSLGYILLYVRDAAASMAFYETAFGLTRTMLHVEGDKAYGELDTGSTKLGLVSQAQAEDVLGQAPAMPARGAAPQGVEIGFVTTEVEAAFAHAVASGAEAFTAPVSKPWGQMVAYVRDPDGHLIEICSPMG